MKTRLSTNISEDTACDMIISIWKNQELAKNINELLFGYVQKEIQDYCEKIDSDIEFILRNKIDMPIKGEITKSKLNWRGITSIVYGYDNKFIGIIQRGRLITKDQKEA